MEFRILGPVQAWGTCGQARLAGPKQLALLSALLLQANRVVPVEQLFEAVWGDNPPGTASGALHTYVFRLRQALTAVEPSAGDRLTYVSGYRLRVEPHELDLMEFRDRAERGRLAAAEGKLYDAAEELTAGLALWRGTALTGVSGQYFQAHTARLAEERLAALEERVGVDLAVGRHAELIPELRDLVATHRLREALHGHLMLALYRAGRPAEALQAFEDIRQALVDELGIDPGPALTLLRQRIVRGDPELSDPHAGERPVPRTDLPGDIADFTGREAELRRLLGALPAGQEGGAVVIEAIDGMAGVGKTTLAVHAAHQLADRYPDAQLFIDLHGHTTEHEATDPAAALDSLLRTLGVPGDQIPQELDARAALWRAELAERDAVIVLDNAADSAQVRPLLPGTARCLALVTSRRRLGDLDTARTLSLDVLPTADAVDLFTRVVGADRTSRHEGQREQVRAVVELCGHLPLAIRIAAARLRTRPAWTVAHLADRLAQGHRGLDELSTGDRSVAAAFGLSYRHLPDRHRRMFRLLGLVPGNDVDTHAAAALCGLGAAEAAELLEDLVDVHLLQQPAPGRYRFHDLIRRHAMDTARDTESEAARREAVTRLLDYYLHTASLAAAHIFPGTLRAGLDVTHVPASTPSLTNQTEAVAWCEAEHANLNTAIGHAAESGRHTHAWQIPYVLWYFYFIRGHTRDWIATHQLALAAAQHLADDRARADLLKQLGSAYWQLGRYDRALDHYREALALYRSNDDVWGESAILGNLGIVYGRLGRYPESLDNYQQALALSRRSGDRWLESNALNHIGNTYDQVGRFADALDHYRQALSLKREIDDRRGEANVLTCMGIAEERLGGLASAFEHHEQSLALMREVGDRRGEGYALSNLGNVHRRLGRLDEALGLHDQGLAIMRDIGDRGYESAVLTDLGHTLRAAGQVDRALACHRQALALTLDIGDRFQEARAHDGIALALRAADPEDARLHWRQALAIYTELGVPEADAVAEHLADPPD
ncbi:AfsR/SARP family transcriptional regulator [Solihabitans fulvus]|uniref:AfsR/SARP family transcriptional regulator n=1 Tax=Solihabitans fulvus TaxID=1892852 RepID=UPI00166209B9|nr:tetratricopeptide repeat protein [Solihabitans fulvus]